MRNITLRFLFIIFVGNQQNVYFQKMMQENSFDAHHVKVVYLNKDQLLSIQNYFQVNSIYFLKKKNAIGCGSFKSAQNHHIFAYLIVDGISPPIAHLRVLLVHFMAPPTNNKS